MPDVTPIREEADASNDLLLVVRTLSNGGRALTTLGVPLIITSKQMAYRIAAWMKVYAELLDDEPLASTFEEVELAVHNS